MVKRVRKASIRRTQRLNKKRVATSTSTPANTPKVDEFYARFLNGDPDRKLTCSEILEIYEHSLAKLEASMQKADLR